MNTFSNHYLQDISQLSQNLSVEENAMAIRCAQKVKDRLTRSVSNGNAHHERNLQIIDQIIASHKEKLNDIVNNIGQIPLAS